MMICDSSLLFGPFCICLLP